MKRGNNIFNGLSRKDENAATEMLCNLLQVKYVRDVCLQFLGLEQKAIDSIDAKDITSQHSLEDVGIPDIEISNTDYYYIIENKIRKNTPLQESQKTTYITKIKNSPAREKGFIFIIPKDYNHTNEIDALRNNETDVEIKYWDELLAHLYSKELDKWSPLIAHSLEFLSDLILEQTTDTRFTPYEVAMLYNPKDAYESIKMARKVFYLIKNKEDGDVLRNVLNKLDKDFDGGDDKYDITSDWKNKIGKYFRYKSPNKPAIFCGLSFDLLDENPQYTDFVFSIAFKCDKLKSISTIDEIKYPYKIVNDWLYVKLPKESILDDSERQSEIFKDTVVDIIKNVFLNNLKENEDQTQ